MADYVPDDYEHLSSRACWARRAVFLLVPLQFVDIALSKVELDFVGRARVGSVTLEEANTLDQRQAILALVEVALVIVAAVFFIRWFHRAYKNLDALGGERKYGTGWAIGYWFVPIVSLVRPKQMADEIWRGSEPSPDAAPASASVISAWWGFWIGAGALGIVASNRDGAVRTLDDLAASDYLAIAVSTLTIVAAFLAMRVVSQITERQERRARALGNAAAFAVAD